MTTPNDPKGEAGSKKAPMWLLPPAAMEQVAWVAKFGAERYGEYNWRKTGVCATTYVSAIMRHLNAWRDGEDLDPESGLSHVAHIATSCNILLDAAHCGTLQDDRNKVSGAEGFPPGFAEAMAGKLDDIDFAWCCTPAAPVEQPAVDAAEDHDRHVSAHARDVAAHVAESNPWVDLGNHHPFGRHDEELVESFRKQGCEVVGCQHAVYDPKDQLYYITDEDHPNSEPRLAGVEGVYISGEFVPFPPVPEGYDCWIDRGWAWGENRPAKYGYWSGYRWNVYEGESAPCGSGCRYIEAVKDDGFGTRKELGACPWTGLLDKDPAAVGPIRPGDQVKIVPVYGDYFICCVSNIIDVRGVKVYQLAHGPSMTEDDIHSITRIS